MFDNRSQMFHINQGLSKIHQNHIFFTENIKCVKNKQEQKLSIRTQVKVNIKSNDVLVDFFKITKPLNKI